MNILLADDDDDDCQFFKESLQGSSLSTHLTTVPDGEQLMNLLVNDENQLPDVLFLDINMPRKNGFQCLMEIRQSSKLNQLPVVIFSTSFEQDLVNNLFRNGATHYIRKPAGFSQFKQIILQTLSGIADGNTTTSENFVIVLQK